MEKPTRLTMDNGMRLIVAEDHAVPAAAVAFCMNVGVCDEAPDRRGVAHFMEHMMFRGSKNVREQDHAQLIARLGGSSNAFTSPDSTTFFETVPNDGIEQVFELEADRFQHLDITAQNTETERKVILEELSGYENQPTVRAMLMIAEQVMAEHPYALGPLGRRADLEALAVEDLQQFYGRCYRPDRAVAVVCGDVSTPQVQELAHRTFGSWRPAVAKKEPTNHAPLQPRTGALSLRLPLEVPLVVQAYRIGPLRDLDRPALQMLDALLSSGASSPMREALVRQRRLCVEAGCSLLTAARGGLLVLYGVFMPPGRHAQRRAVMNQITQELVENGPNADQFERHLKRFRMAMANDTYSHQARAQGLGHAELFEGGFEHYHHALEHIAAVTPQRVRDLARSVFAPENALSLDVTPQHTRWWMWALGLFLRMRSR